MENITNGSVTRTVKTLKEGDILWITGEVILVTITTYTLYIFLSLLYYTWRRRLAVGVSGNVVEARERYLLMFCNFAILFAVARCVLHQCILWLIDLNDKDQCSEFVIVSNVTYNITICLTYMYLWLRLRNFYTSADIVKLRSKCMDVIDWMVFFLVIVVSIVMAIMTFVIPVKKDEWVTYHTERCNAFEYSNKNMLMVYAGLACLFQTVLLGLYVYPLVHLRRKHKNSKESSNLNMSMYLNLKRSLTMLVICIVTDIAASTAASRLTKYYPQLFVSILALYDINLVINITCTICTFRNWRKIIFGFPLCRRLIETREAMINYNKRKKERKASSDFDTTTFSSTCDHTMVDTLSITSEVNLPDLPAPVKIIPSIV